MRHITLRCVKTVRTTGTTSCSSSRSVVSIRSTGNELRRVHLRPSGTGPCLKTGNRIEEGHRSSICK